jgi:alpha-tubulin suppressor-like RCC1 family protein
MSNLNIDRFGFYSPSSGGGGGGGVIDGVYIADDSGADLYGVNVISGYPNLFQVADTIDNVYMSCIGIRHILAIRNYVVGTGGELWVWGLNTSGSIGGSNNYQWSRIGVDADWTFVTAGLNSSMAIKAGSLYAAGAGASFVFGNNSTANLTTFTQIGSDTDWEFVAIGESFSFAIKNSRLFSTGSNSDFKTGLNTSAGNTQIWTLVNNTEIWSFVSCGRSHGIATTTDGKLYSWGVNSSGRTGQGTTVGSTQIPTRIGLDTDWYICQAGNLNSYALKNNGTAWGCGTSTGSFWGASSPTSMTQDSSAATDWDWLMCNASNSVFAKKTNGTLYSSGAAIGNATKVNLTSFQQVGIENTFKINFFGNHNGFAGETTFIK